MQLTMFDQQETSASSSGKTSPESSPTKAMRSGASLVPWWANPMRSSRQGENGRTLVVCMAPAEQQHGGCWMPNISAWLNDAAVCSLSQVLEQGSIPQRYFLSPKACAGIIRRAEVRGKKLPEQLAAALLAAAGSAPTLNATADFKRSAGGGRTSGPVDVAACLVAKGQKCDFEVETFCVHGTQDPCVSTETAFALGRNNGGENAVFAIQAGALRTNPLSGPDGVGVQADHAYTLEARAEVQAVAYDILGTPASEVAKSADIHTPLRARIPGQLENSTVTMIQQPGAAVRRLTPRETERLQGFKDDYTLIPWRGKPAEECPDGPRYKAIGNSKAVPVVRWIGMRIQRELERAQ